jgi:hypothetical protein
MIAPARIYILSNKKMLLVIIEEREGVYEG